MRPARFPCPRGARPLADPATLPPWLRPEAVGEGLTTEALGAWFGEALAIERLVQRERRLGRARPALGLGPGEAVLDRWIALRGERTSALRLVAHVEISLGRASERLAAGLRRGDATLGELVRRVEPGARRGPLGTGLVERLPRAARGPVPGGPWVLRRYRIVVRGATLAVVSEYFPRGEEAATARARAS